jgi:hypothetical protein
VVKQAGSIPKPLRSDYGFHTDDYCRRRIETVSV